MRPALLTLLMIIAACTAKEPGPAVTVRDYFPLKSGAYQIYSVDSIAVSQNVETTYQFELRLQVIDSFPASGGGFVYVIQRSRRTDATSPWMSVESWSARAEASQLVVNEGNNSYVKIAAPLVDGKTWNGNAFNTLGGTEKCLDGNSYTCDNYTLSSMGKPYQTEAGRTFQNTLTVIQSDNQDPIVAQDIRKEVYAKNTGLVYRETTILNYCTDPSCLGTQFVQSGVKYRQMVSEYGGL